MEYKYVNFKLKNGIGNSVPWAHVEILTTTKNKIKIRIENNGIIVWRFIFFSSIVVINNAIKIVWRPNNWMY